MVGLCPKNHHSFQRTMNVLTLILLIGHLESKVATSQKDHLKPLGRSCSRHNSRRDTGSLLVPRQMAKMEEVLHPKIQRLMNEQLPADLGPLAVILVPCMDNGLFEVVQEIN